MAELTERLPSAFRSPWVRGLIGRYGLQVWFFALTVTRMGAFWYQGLFALDARIYIGGVRNWLRGEDPWASYVVAQGRDLHFAAPPTNLLPIVPFALLPGDLGAWLMVACCAVAGVWIVRLLGMPWWWMLFPPLAEGIQSGNPQVVLTAFLIAGGRLAVLAPILKVYAAIPLVLLGRGKETVGAAVVFALASLLTWQLWLEYIPRFGEISSRLAAEASGGFSAWAWPPLLPVAAVAILVLLILDRPRGAWLAVPALWPSSEFHYNTLTMPVIGKWAPWLFALVGWLFAPITVILVAMETLVRHRLARQRTFPEE